MKIYVVKGHAGEYSGHREWPVGAFREEEKAKRMVERASIYAASGEDYYKSRQTRNPYDPNMETDYTGTSYDYYEVELFDEVPVVES